MKPVDVFAYKIKNFKSYPSFPFSPAIKYPEYPFESFSEVQNPVYDGVRSLFIDMGLDRENFGKKTWNPLKEIIGRGSKILIKPNMVMDCCQNDPSLTSLVTHPSLLRAILDYLFIALGGKGKITIGDAPLQNCDFNNLKEKLSLVSLMNFYKNEGGKNFFIQFQDFRQKRAITDSHFYRIKEYKKVNPLKNFTAVDLAKKSFFTSIENDFSKYRVSNYSPLEMSKHHCIGKNEYLIHNSVLSADVIINLPKLKIHKKAGITCCLKNFIGVNGNKDWLPHYRAGNPSKGGDNYPRKRFSKILEEKLTDWEFSNNNFVLRLFISLPKNLCRLYYQKILRDPVFDGSWSGNDTLWRTILDINKIVKYADKGGFLKTIPQRQIFNLVDALVIGEGDSPLNPTPLSLGLIFAGTDQLYLDCFAAKVLGLNPDEISQISHGVEDVLIFPINSKKGNYSDIKVRMDGKELALNGVKCIKKPKLPLGWITG